MRIQLTAEQIYARLGLVAPETVLGYSIQSLCFDTRKIILPEHSLFIALKTDRRDGHPFCQQAYEKGIRFFLVSKLPEDPLPEAHFLKVEDTLEALQRLALSIRSDYMGEVVGITGSNGKTIVKEWLFHALHGQKTVYRSPRSFNSQLGVPLSLCGLSQSAELALIEAGISQPGEMEKLAKIIVPQTGIFTSLGDAHAEFFPDKAAKVREKFSLFSSCQRLFSTVDYPEVVNAIEELKLRNPDLALFTWSLNGLPASLQLKTQENFDGFSRLLALYQGEEKTLILPGSDKASVENGLCCWLFLLQLGLSDEEIQEGMKGLPSLSMRLELKNGINHTRLINDSWSLDLSSFQTALEYQDTQHHRKTKTLILSDFRESGLESEKLFQEVSRLMKRHKIHKIIGIGPEISRNAAFFQEFDAHFYLSTDNFLRSAGKMFFFDETILIKGARDFAFEKIDEFLSEQVHQTVLEIDLDALTENYQVYRSCLKPDTRIMVMVKAFSYGSGSAEVAGMMQYQKSDYLTVAYADEGIALREAGITLPIMVMNSEVQSFSKMLRHSLEPEIYSLNRLEDLIAWMEAEQIEQMLPLHINVDTGMNRLGFTLEELPLALRKIVENPGLKVASIYSHLAASEDPDLEHFTHLQFDRFETAVSYCEEILGYRPLRHILNTAGIVNYPEKQFEMVRLGIGLYGYDSAGKIQDKLQVVSTLKTVISQIRTIKPGESVGYNRKGVVDRESRIATLALGYADGIARKLGNGKAKFWINGKLAPTIGSICMDMCMVDVTDIDCKEGDRVIIFGKEHSVKEIAKSGETIPYEIFTGISPRVRRIYVKT